MPLEIYQFPCRSDNYGVLVHDPESGATASIDAPDAEAVERELAAKGWRLSHILTTHHHQDHVEGNTALKAKHRCVIVGPASEASKIPGIDQLVSGGQRFTWAGRDIQVFDCPGHTAGHIAFLTENVLFAGDTLFAMGCGRVLEGSMAQMWQSLNQFRSLPPKTLVYCGHEYTVANARFALSVEPGNTKLQSRAKKVSEQRERGVMTCPTTIGEELETNPFLRPESSEIRNRIGAETYSDADVFSELRRRKDSFK